MAAQAAQHEGDQQEEAKAHRKALKQARHRGRQAQAQETEAVAQRARTSAEASAAPHTNNRLRRARKNALTSGALNEKGTRQCEEHSERAANCQMMNSDKSSDYEANASAYACYVSHDDGSSMDMN